MDIPVSEMVTLATFVGGLIASRIINLGKSDTETRADVSTIKANHHGLDVRLGKAEAKIEDHGQELRAVTQVRTQLDRVMADVGQISRDLSELRATLMAHPLTTNQTPPPAANRAPAGRHLPEDELEMLFDHLRSRIRG
jgi:hypothetical protein